MVRKFVSQLRDKGSSIADAELHLQTEVKSDCLKCSNRLLANHSDVSLADFLVANNYEVLEVHAPFLPLSVESRLPISVILICPYLNFPVHPMGKPMLVRAKPLR
jgi:hypothetical protein